MLCEPVTVTSLYFILQHFATVERFQWVKWTTFLGCHSANAVVLYYGGFIRLVQDWSIAIALVPVAGGTSLPMLCQSRPLEPQSHATGELNFKWQMKTNPKGLISNPYQVKVDGVPIRLYSKNCVDQYLWQLHYNLNANGVPVNY